MFYVLFSKYKTKVFVKDRYRSDKHKKTETMSQSTDQTSTANFRYSQTSYYELQAERRFGKRSGEFKFGFTLGQITF